MDELDRILLSDEPVLASLGFEARVMEAVRGAAAAPPPLPFPWGRFVLGLVACGVWAAASVGLARQVDTSVVSHLAAVAPELRHAALAVMTSLGVVYAPRIFARV